MRKSHQESQARHWQAYENEMQLLGLDPNKAVLDTNNPHIQAMIREQTVFNDLIHHCTFGNQIFQPQWDPHQIAAGTSHHAAGLQQDVGHQVHPGPQQVPAQYGHPGHLHPGQELGPEHLAQHLPQPVEHAHAQQPQQPYPTTQVPLQQPQQPVQHPTQQVPQAQQAEHPLQQEPPLRARQDLRIPQSQGPEHHVDDQAQVPQHPPQGQQAEPPLQQEQQKPPLGVPQDLGLPQSQQPGSHDQVPQVVQDRPQGQQAEPQEVRQDLPQRADGALGAPNQELRKPRPLPQPLHLRGQKAQQEQEHVPKAGSADEVPDLHKPPPRVHPDLRFEPLIKQPPFGTPAVMIAVPWPQPPVRGQSWTPAEPPPPVQPRRKMWERWEHEQWDGWKNEEWGGKWEEETWQNAEWEKSEWKSEQNEWTNEKWSSEKMMDGRNGTVTGMAGMIMRAADGGIGMTNPGRRRMTRNVVVMMTLTSLIGPCMCQRQRRKKSGQIHQTSSTPSNQLDPHQGICCVVRHKVKTTSCSLKETSRRTTRLWSHQKDHEAKHKLSMWRDPVARAIFRDPDDLNVSYVARKKGCFASQLKHAYTWCPAYTYPGHAYLISMIYRYMDPSGYIATLWIHIHSHHESYSSICFLNLSDLVHSVPRWNNRDQAGWSLSHICNTFAAQWAMHTRGSGDCFLVRILNSWYLFEMWTS